MQVLKNNAADNAHDPSDADLRSDDEGLCSAFDKLDKYIKVVGEDKAMDAEKPRQADPARTQRSPAAASSTGAGEMVWDCLHAQFGYTQKADDQDARRRWTRS